MRQSNASPKAILDSNLISRKKGLTADEKVVQGLIEKFEEKLDGYERVLGKQKYIAGDVSHSLLAVSRLTSDFSRRNSRWQMYVILCTAKR